MYKNKISDYLHASKYKRAKIYMASFCIASALAFQSCSEKSEVFQWPEPEEPDYSNLSFRLDAFEESIMENALLYVFTSNDYFKGKQYNIERDENVLKTFIEQGLWNLVLLSCDSDIESDIILPTSTSSDKANFKMWETKTYVENGETFLMQTPEELRYGFIENVNVTQTGVTRASGVLSRNVCKVEILMGKNHTGFDPMQDGKSTDAYFELSNVVTALNWEGNHYPDTATAVPSPHPIREYIEFENDSAYAVTFIVPAHKGDELLNDTSTKKLMLKACMPLGGLPFEGKGKVEIPHVPRPNTILRVNLTFRGEPFTNLDIKVNVLPWVPYEDDQIEIF